MFAALDRICNGSDEPLSEKDLCFIFDCFCRVDLLSHSKKIREEIKHDGGFGPVPDEIVDDRVVLHLLKEKLQASRLVPRLLATLKEFMGLEDVQKNFTDAYKNPFSNSVEDCRCDIAECDCECEGDESIYSLSGKDLDYLNNCLGDLDQQSDNIISLTEGDFHVFGFPLDLILSEIHLETLDPETLSGEGKFVVSPIGGMKKIFLQSYPFDVSFLNINDPLQNFFLANCSFVPETATHINDNTEEVICRFIARGVE